MYSFASYMFAFETNDSRGKMLFGLLRLLRKMMWEEITITDICLEAGVSRKSFYKHFQDKNGILDYLDQAIYLAYNKQDDHTDLLFYFNFWYEMRDWVDVLVRNNLFASLACTNEERNSFLRPCIWNKGLAENSEYRLIMMEFVSAGLIRMVERWSKDGWKRSPQEMADIADYIIQGKFSRVPLK